MTLIIFLITIIIFLLYRFQTVFNNLCPFIIISIMFLFSISWQLCSVDVCTRRPLVRMCKRSGTHLGDAKPGWEGLRG